VRFYVAPELPLVVTPGRASVGAAKFGQVLIKRLVPKRNLGGSIPCRGPRPPAGPEKVRFGATRLPAAVRGGCLVSGGARLRR